MEKQVNSICNQLRNIGLIRKYINDEKCKTLVQVLVISRLDYGNALLYNIPLCRHALAKGTYDTSFVPAALAFYTFQITVQDPVSYIQSTERNSTNVSKRSDQKIYTNENAPI